MKHATFVIALALCGCSVPAAPVPDDGIFSAECSINGVRRERGDPDRVIAITSPDSLLEIRGGAVVINEECLAPVVNFDGTDFDIQPTDCMVLDGTVRYTTMEVRDGHGSLVDGVLSLEVSVFWDRTVSGWSEEYTVTCAGSR